MNRRTWLAFAMSIPLIALLFVVDVSWGSVHISLDELWRAFTDTDSERIADYLIIYFRLPKALTALFVGAGIATAGLMMQCLFRNPLADTSILGVGSGAGLGVAIYTMAFALFPALATSGMMSTWGVVLAAFSGAMLVLLIISSVSAWLHDVVSVLLVGVMIGFIASALISVLQFFSDEETLKGYLLWSFGSLSGTTWRQLQILLPIVSFGLLMALLMPKYMNAMNIGERYTRSVGINPRYVRITLILITSIISGTITAFTGPIAFLGIAVPHFARIIFGTSNNRILIPATIVSGSILMLICDILTQMPGYQVVLPINAVTSLIGAPVVIFVMLRERRAYSL